jgi:hypothetical protein
VEEGWKRGGVDTKRAHEAHFSLAGGNLQQYHAEGQRQLAAALGACNEDDKAAAQGIDKCILHLSALPYSTSQSRCKHELW